MPDTSAKLLSTVERVAALYRRAAALVAEREPAAAQKLLATARELVESLRPAESEAREQSPAVVTETDRRRARAAAEELTGARAEIEQVCTAAAKGLLGERKEVAQGLFQLRRLRELLTRNEARYVDTRL